MYSWFRLLLSIKHAMLPVNLYIIMWQVFDAQQGWKFNMMMPFCHVHLNMF